MSLPQRLWLASYMPRLLPRACRRRSSRSAVVQLSARQLARLLPAALKHPRILASAAPCLPVVWCSQHVHTFSRASAHALPLPALLLHMPVSFAPLPS